MTATFAIFADYHQFYIRDDDPSYGDLSDAWTPESTDRLLALAPHTIGVGTARNMTVPVSMSILAQRPTLDAATFDRINEAAIEIATGRIVLAGCTDYVPDAPRIPCAPGRYGVLIGYRNLTRLSEDGLDGDDSYHLYLWPANG